MESFKLKNYLSQKKKIFAMLIFATAVAIAKSYSFHVSSIPRFKDYTFEADQATAFNAANSIAMTYTFWSSIWSKAFGTGTTIYIVYADGQIGQFTVVIPGNTQGLKFEGKVDAVPSGTKSAGADGGGGGGDGGESRSVIVRNDGYDNRGLAWWQETKWRTATVTVGPLVPVHGSNSWVREYEDRGRERDWDRRSECDLGGGCR
jgi:hypothetical protein